MKHAYLLYLLSKSVDTSGNAKKFLVLYRIPHNNPLSFNSGLDSSSSFQCINLLKTLAQGGRTIICTIHQPSAKLFEKFDYLYALAEGQCIYRGAIHGLIPFLAAMGLECPSYHNPADFCTLRLRTIFLCSNTS